LFRAQSFPAALRILQKMAGLSPGGVAWLYSPLLVVLPIVITAHVVGIMAARRAGPTGVRLSGVYVVTKPNFVGAFLIASWVLAVLLFGATGANPFVYFQF
jgi:hypothetical protein